MSGKQKMVHSFLLDCWKTLAANFIPATNSILLGELTIRVSNKNINVANINKEIDKIKITNIFAANAGMDKIKIEKKYMEKLILKTWVGIFFLSSD